MRKFRKIRERHNVFYIGNAAYCYANSTAMLLAAIGENISPAQIEVLTGVGLGVFLDKKKGLIFFSNLTASPDRGISKALEILGFSFVKKSKEKAISPPFKELRDNLKKAPVLLGPLDMSYLSYNPNIKRLSGKEIDHFVLVYDMDSSAAYLHDPAGFPYVSIPLDKLALALEAKDISYKQGYYQYWTLPKRISNPSIDEIYDKALRFFKLLYEESREKINEKQYSIGEKAIVALANLVRKRALSPYAIDHLQTFAFKLGAKRAIDFAMFFNSHHDNELSSLKQQQAEVLGSCHSLLVSKNWYSLAQALEKLASLEEKISYQIIARTNL